MSSSDEEHTILTATEAGRVKKSRQSNKIVSTAPISTEKSEIAENIEDTQSLSTSTIAEDATNGINTQEEVNNIERISNQFNRNMIIYYGKELICIVALILTTFASFQNSTPKITRPPPPQHFFPHGSFVHDWPAGHLGPTQSRVSVSELSFVLYYAPWCAESQFARSSYEHVAKHFYREAHFAAINCWQPGGECRQQYAKVQSWPVLMAYLPDGLAVQYHAQWQNSALTRFILSFMNPIKRLTDPDDLLKQMTGHDAVVVAFVDMKKNPKFYKTFFQAAVKWLEKDPFQELIFGCVSGASAKIFGVDHVPSIRLYMWNETMEYFGNSSSTVDDLSKWITNQMQQVSLWLMPPGTKSAFMAPYLKQGPALILFTPRNLYMETNDAYEMIRQIGMEYYNCLNDNWVNEMSREYIVQQRQENYKNYNTLKRECSNQLKIFDIDNQKSSHKKSVTVSFVHTLNVSKQLENNAVIKNICEIGSPEKPEKPQDKYLHDAISSTCQTTGAVSMQEEEMKTDVCYFPKRPYKCENDFDMKSPSTSEKTSMIHNEFDNRGPENLMRNLQRKKCELLYLAEKESDTLFFHDDKKQDFSLVSGLSCKYNKTISLIVIDSIAYHAFAERLGIDILNVANKSAAVIVDAENESTFILQEPISFNSIASFMQNYTKRSLARHFKSSSSDFLFTHFYSDSTNRNQSTIGRSPGREDAKIVKPNININYPSADDRKLESDKKFPEVYIMEINSENFIDCVLKSNKTIVVFFYSSNCAFCNLMSQNLLIVSKILSHINNLQFLRIDGDKNDLAWQYTMEIFPTLIIFPAESKSESRIFPTNIKVTTQNILGFVMANLNRPNRLYAIVLACKASKKIPSMENCFSVLRTEIVDNISYSLRQWRKLPQYRSLILRRLQSLQRFYLQLYRNFDHSCDFIALEESVKNIVKIWTKFI